MARKDATCICYQKQGRRKQIVTAKCTSELTERKVSHFYVKCETTISVELLSFKLILFAYFEEGMSASEAFHHHETLLMKDPVTHATG